MNPLLATNPYKRHRFPAEIISHSVWLYYRFSFSYREVQTTSKFAFRWWGVNSTLSGKRQLHRLSGPHSMEEEALDVLESRV